MNIFQIVAAFFGLLMMYIVSIHAKRRTFSSLESMLWLSLWGLFVMLAIFPGLLQGIADTLHFSRVFDLLVVGAFMVLVYLTFSNYIAHKKLRTKLEDFVRKAAIKNAKEVNQ
jgi:hypothetical protein